jgi:hypothetical protein
MRKLRFAVNSLKIPWWVRKLQCLCGFSADNFFYGKNLPDKFPAQGIAG